MAGLGGGAGPGAVVLRQQRAGNLLVQARGAVEPAEAARAATAWAARLGALLADGPLHEDLVASGVPPPPPSPHPLLLQPPVLPAPALQFAPTRPGARGSSLSAPAPALAKWRRQLPGCAEARHVESFHPGAD